MATDKLVYFSSLKPKFRYITVFYVFTVLVHILISLM